MDSIEAVLREHAAAWDDAVDDWSILNNSAVVVVSARTLVARANPEEAIADARALTALLTATEYEVVNRLELAAVYEPVRESEGWRGSVDGLFARRDRPESDWIVIKLTAAARLI